MKRVRLIGLGVSLILAGCNGKSPTTPTPVDPTPSTPTLYTISGVVQQAGNGPGLSATVRVVDGSSAGQSANTDSDGGYRLTGLTFAGFNIEASATGYNTLSRPALLTAGATTKTENFSLLPTALWTKSGTGNQVFEMPTYVSRVRIAGTFPGSCQNFAVRVASRVLVNVILGTCSIADSRAYEGTHLTSGGVVETVISTGVSWSFTEVR